VHGPGSGADQLERPPARLVVGHVQPLQRPRGNRFFDAQQAEEKMLGAHPPMVETTGFIVSGRESSTRVSGETPEHFLRS
jgi:hypothetical protein